MTLAELIDLHEGQMLEITLQEGVVVGAAVTYDWDEVAVYDRAIDVNRYPEEWAAIEQAWIDAGKPEPKPDDDVLDSAYGTITLDRNGTLVT